MKKTYIIPSLTIVSVMHEMPIAASNQLDGSNNVSLNPNSMDEGTGDDAVREDVGWDIWGDAE